MTSCKNTINKKNNNNDNLSTSTDTSSTQSLSIDEITLSYYHNKLKKLFQYNPYQSDHIIYPDTFIQKFCHDLKKVLEKTVLIELNKPNIHICGDIHGDYVILLRIFLKCGLPSESNIYLFLGDYVDRGNNSLDVIILLGILKILYPQYIYLLAGNHESASTNLNYGFHDECNQYISITTSSSSTSSSSSSTNQTSYNPYWCLINEMFTCFPICAIVNYKFFCTHGGISPTFLRNRSWSRTDLITEINKISRSTEMYDPMDSILCDLLWSDPDDTIEDFQENERGCSYIYSKQNVLDFCNQYGFDLIIRAHQLKDNGYEKFANNQLITIFSAPNYCGENNYASILIICSNFETNEFNIDIQKFDSICDPNILAKINLMNEHDNKAPLHDKQNIHRIKSPKLNAPHRKRSITH